MNLREVKTCPHCGEHYDIITRHHHEAQEPDRPLCQSLEEWSLELPETYPQLPNPSTAAQFG